MKQLLRWVMQIRKEHPVMGSRKMYWKSLQQLPIGRDRCEKILLSSGFRIIKNEYIKKWHIQSLNQLKQALTKAGYAYKHGRPHNNLPQRLTPVKFEESLEAGLIEAPIMELYKHEVES